MESTLPDTLPPRGENPWRDAIEDACVVGFLPFDPNDDPRQQLANLVSFEIDVALDPQVSKRALDLMGSGAQADALRWRKLVRMIEMGDDAIFDRIEQHLQTMGVAPDTALIARDFLAAFDAASDGISTEPLTGSELLGDVFEDGADFPLPDLRAVQ